MLTDTKINGKECEPKTKAFKVADSNGLYLEILPTGKKYLDTDTDTAKTHKAIPSKSTTP
ncbi:Arm DNA-binding domain-containing protein [Candidatus Thiodubiliella endoseptemdiera]|uniref:Arm DNA-binding domain-containing protein n=1 Tax=Candidatus Thiodubiliella endoseptemdiera TaxID=2738886 RepID=UPI0034DEC2AB